MTEFANPALAAFVAQIGGECVVAQVLIRRDGSGFELRHHDDRDLSTEALELMEVDDLRGLVQMTEKGVFRPLKSAPTLRRGWRVMASNSAALEGALNHLYPGALADWYAATLVNPPVTHYREFTARQTGMYRITATLNDVQAVAVIKGCCDSKFCLKQRLWTVAGLEADSVATTSVIPCLEPCPVFLEFARKAARIEQEDKMTVSLGASELETLMAVLETVTMSRAESMREADFGEAGNPRRVQLLLEKLKSLPVTKQEVAGN